MRVRVGDRKRTSTPQRSRCRGDIAEIKARYRGDIDEIHGRYRRDIGRAPRRRNGPLPNRAGQRAACRVRVTVRVRVGVRVRVRGRVRVQP